MERVRASSLETNLTSKNKHDTFPDTFNQSNVGRNRINSLLCNQRDLNDEGSSMDYYGREMKRPMVSNSQLKDQLDLLQCTVNKMLKTGEFNEVGASCPSVNISESLKHEYRQMMSALKELETILSLKRKSVDTIGHSNGAALNDSQVHQFQHEIYCRDSLIKALTDRLKVLCKANDKLIIDYENQESMLSEELLCLKRQLEHAKDAMRALSIMKKRSSMQSNQAAESDAHYLRESLCTKEMIIADLKHRIERLTRENSTLKCELENREVSMPHCLPSPFDRDVPFLKHINEQMKDKIESLTDSLELKKCLINDLQSQLDCRKDDDMNRHLRQQLIRIEDENELRKEEMLQQQDMLDDCRSQIQILSENSCYKDDTITELKACLRKYTDTEARTSRKESVKEVQFRTSDLEPRASTLSEKTKDSLILLLNSVKKHLNQHHPELLHLLGSDPDAYKDLEKFVFDLTDLVSQPSNDRNDIELFKEFLTNEINLKNKIANFLTNNTTSNIESVEKLQNQLNSLLSIDMDDGFNNDLKNYLHQCYLSDDNLRSVIEYLVKYINSVPVKSAERESISRGTFVENKEMPIVASVVSDENIKLKSVEDELRRVSLSLKRAKDLSSTELDRLSAENGKLDSNVKSLQTLQRKSISDLETCRNQNQDLENENERLKRENQGLKSKIAQMEKDIINQTAELDNLDKSMKGLSKKFVDINSANDSAKDHEIERMKNELVSVIGARKSLEKVQSEQIERISELSRDSTFMKDLKIRASEMERIIDELRRQLQDMQDKLDGKDRAIRDLEQKLADDALRALEIKSLEDQNKQLQDKLTKCMEEKSNLDLKLKEMNIRLSDQENSKSLMLRTSIHSLNMENKSLEMKSNSLVSEKSLLTSQIKQLKGQIEELLKFCADNHVDKSALRKDSQESDICKQKIIDLEAILALLTEELNEKAQSLEEIRRMIKNQPLLELCPEKKPENVDHSSFSQHLLSQKESEINNLRSKLENLENRKSLEASKGKSVTIDNSELIRAKQTILELENSVDLLKQQLTDRSDTIAQLQQLLKEKDSIIENAGKMIRTKNDSLIQSERLSHLLSMQNTNIKDELSASYDWKSELNLLKSSNNNLRDEIQVLKQENNRLKEAVSTKLPSVLVTLPEIPDTSAGQINEEIHKLYTNFEEKKNELKEYSIKEIKSRDAKLDEVNFELRLKSDQIQKILIENRRLSDQIENESQRTDRYEQTLLLKEQLLQKMLQEKEKIRATFITELRCKNEELNEKSKTVYFLNAEIHRLSSDLEIMEANLHTVRATDQFHVTQSRILEISQAELNSAKEENTSLKFCVSMKMAEVEATKHELTIQQLGNKQLNDEINILKVEITERENRMSKHFEENEEIKRDLLNLENEAQGSVDSLQTQLKHVKDDYGKLNDSKFKLERAMQDLANENRSLKQVMEECENEKMNYREEIEGLRNELELMNFNLRDSSDTIQRVSQKYEKEQENNRRLSIVIDINEKSKMTVAEEINHVQIQLDKVTNENCQLREEIERLSDLIRNLEHNERNSLNKEDQINKTMKDMERKIRSLEIENDGMNKELNQYQQLEKQLDERIQRKSLDCEELRKEHDDLIQMLEKYQLQMDSMENREQMAQLSLNEERSKCHHLQDSLDMAKQQLLSMEEKWNCCNNSWLDKYGQLRNKFEKLECDYLQEQHHNDTIRLDQKMLDVTAASQRQELDCLNCKNQQLSEECSRLEQENLDLHNVKCDNISLREYNAQMQAQIESLNKELVAAHTEIWNAQLKINENQASISNLCSRLNNKLTTDRRYGSQPLLNRMDLCGASLADLEQRDYNDLKTRYNALCSQVDTMVSQLKKKDKRIAELEATNEVNNFNSLSHDQLKCDYDDLDKKYQRLQIEFSQMSQQYHFNSLEHLENQSHVVQACNEEFLHALQIKDQELAQLRAANQRLTDDYHACCERLRDLDCWQRKYDDKAENCQYMESEFKELKRQNDNLLSELREKNCLKQELMEMNGRIVDLMNCNSNLEQQLANSHKTTEGGHRTVEELNAQLNNLESYYECEIERCRKEILLLKNNNISYSTDLAMELKDKDNLINCINEEIRSAQCDLSALRNKFSLQCHQLDTCKEKLCHEKCTREELQQEYLEQSNNIDQLSAQLFDSRDLIERLTQETRRMSSVIAEKQCKINQLAEKIDLTDQCLQAKDNEIRESKRSIGLLENNLQVRDVERHSLLNQIVDFTEQKEQSADDEKFNKELSICYQMIESLRDELTKLNEENEKINSIMQGKDQQIHDYDRALSLSNHELEKFRGELSNRRIVSATELSQLNEASHKLSGELNYLQQTICADFKSQETQTSERDKINFLAPSPVSHDSSEAHSSWKATNTDKKDNDDDGGGVKALEQAIDDYTSLLSDIDGRNEKPKTSKSASTQHTDGVDQKNQTSRSISSHQSEGLDKGKLPSKSVSSHHSEIPDKGRLPSTSVSSHHSDVLEKRRLPSKSVSSHHSDVLEKGRLPSKSVSSHHSDVLEKGRLPSKSVSSHHSDLLEKGRLPSKSVSSHHSDVLEKGKLPSKSVSSHHSEDQDQRLAKGKSVSSHHTNSVDKGDEFQNQVPDVIFVEVDSEIPGKPPSHKSSFDGKLSDVLEMFKNSKLCLNYEENNETPEEFFGRVIARNTELEQFFLASLKIQFKQPVEDDTMELFDNFSENVDNTKTILREHCKQLNDMIVPNETELNYGPDEVTATHMTTTDVKSLIDLVKTQQLQMGALSVGFTNLQETCPFKGTKAGKVNVKDLSLPYEELWKTQEVCSPMVQEVSPLAIQTPTTEELSRVPSIELHLSVIISQEVMDDSFIDRVPSKVLSRESLGRSASPPKQLNAAESFTEKFGSDTFSQPLPSITDATKRSVGDKQGSHTARLSQPPSVQFQAPESNLESQSNDRSHKIPDRASSVRSRSSDKVIQRPSCNRFGTETKTHTFRDDSHSRTSRSRELSDSYKKSTSSHHMSTAMNKCRPQSMGSRVSESIVSKVLERASLKSPGKGGSDDSRKISDKRQSITAKEKSESMTTKLQATESRVHSPYDDALQKVSDKEVAKSSVQPSSVDKSVRSMKQEVLLDVVIPLDALQYQALDDGTKSAMQSVKTTKRLNSVSDSVSVVSIDCTIKIKTATETHLGDINDGIDKGPFHQIEHQSAKTSVKDPADHNKNGPAHLQKVSEGLSVKEGKAKSIAKVDDGLGHAMVDHFDKDMHQVGHMEVNNLDSSIDDKNKIRIYSSEIDYLNEKNLFHTYAINVLTEPSRYPYNNNFLDQINASLMAKAKHLNTLQAEFKFNPHISDTEKALIAKVLGSKYTYKDEFLSWMELQKKLERKSVTIDPCADLKAELDKCRSAKAKDAAQNEKFIKDLNSEKENLRSSIEKMNKLKEENDDLKKQIKSSSQPVSKVATQTSVASANKQSKIPLMKGSNIEPQNVTKTNPKSEMSSYETVPTLRSEKVSSMRISPGQLVTPEEVRKAISGEVSIENLRRFANLLAEDNFDLSAEIEKLLVTIEKLRRQLKDNCEILAETVEMLQNSENFVNDLEKQLLLETKKTMNISDRIDKLNDVNKLVISELQRILKGKAPPAGPHMDTQDTCNYLLECLKKLEDENMALEILRQ